MQGLSISEFESLLAKLITEKVTEIASLNKQAAPPQKDEKYLTRVQAAKRLNLTAPTLRKYSYEGLIPSYRIGRRVLYKEDEINKALQLVHSQKFRKL